MKGEIRWQNETFTSITRSKKKKKEKGRKETLLQMKNTLAL
jgi:hypothetical protein